MDVHNIVVVYIDFIQKDIEYYWSVIFKNNYKNTTFFSSLSLSLMIEVIENTLLSLTLWHFHSLSLLLGYCTQIWVAKTSSICSGFCPICIKLLWFSMRFFIFIFIYLFIFFIGEFYYGLLWVVVVVLGCEFLWDL